MINYVLAQGGLKPSDVAFIGVGAGAGAIAALRAGPDRRDVADRPGDDHARAGAAR